MNYVGVCSGALTLQGHQAKSKGLALVGKGLQ